MENQPTQTDEEELKKIEKPEILGDILKENWSTEESD